MLDRSDTGCEVCKKIPVLEKEDMEWFSSGQPLSSLVAEAIANINGGGAVSMTNTSPEGAMDSVSNTMDELEALFGFSDEPKEVKKAEDDEDDDPRVRDLNSSDIPTEYALYRNKKVNYIQLRSKNLKIKYCPVCGSKI